MRQAAVLLPALLLTGCVTEPPQPRQPLASYFDNAGRDDVLSGGVKMIPVQTAKGSFHVWTKRTGNNPKIKASFCTEAPAQLTNTLKLLTVTSPARVSNTTITTSSAPPTAISPMHPNSGTFPASSTKSNKCARP